MDILTLKQSLPYIFKARVSTFLWGHYGIGKSQAIKQYCKENNYLYFDLRLGNVEVGDLLGLADFTVDKEGQKTSTKFITPDWLKGILDWAEKNPQSKAVIFMDELPRARRDVLQAVFQMVLDHKHHTTEFPANVHVIAAGNPPTEDYIQTDISDKALLDRFVHIKLTPTVKEWVNHAENNNFNKSVVNFIKTDNSMLDSTSSSYDIEVFPSRRSWEVVSRLVDAETPENILQELCFGTVGKPATIAFFESMKNADKPIEAAEILKNYDKYVDRIKDYSNDKTGGRQDLLKVTCDDLKKLLETRDTDKKELKPKEVKNMLSFIKAIPVDLSFALVREVYMLDSCRDHLDNDNELVELFEKRAG
jgi:hypothetical protein